jgi:hypothetical protein
MISAALLMTVLKYLVLTACTACWVYAVYHATIFEGRLSTKDPFSIEALNHPTTLFRPELQSKRARESRRKVFAALTLFAVLGVCLLVILFFDVSGPPRSPFLFHDNLG